MGVHFFERPHGIYVWRNNLKYFINLKIICKDFVTVFKIPFLSSVCGKDITEVSIKLQLLSLCTAYCEFTSLNIKNFSFYFMCSK